MNHFKFGQYHLKIISVIQNDQEGLVIPFKTSLIIVADLKLLFH